LEELTPKEIVAALDRHIVGQDRAKRTVAIAMRNRWRRQQVEASLRREIVPNNILMIGPTGVGKTAIARRLADLAGAPFIKVEASKFTEVGYVGRDVESIIRDLTDLSVEMVREQYAVQVEDQARQRVNAILVELLAGAEESDKDKSSGKARAGLQRALQAGELEGRLVEIEAGRERLPMVEVFSPVGINVEERAVQFQEVVSGLLQQLGQRKQVEVAQARRLLLQDEIQKLIDMDKVVETAVDQVQSTGIVFLDEVDKIAEDHARSGPDVSRQGVQRDLLPVLEGNSVATRYGLVRTDHILFIAAGAFHTTRPTDLIPEFQGRFPIRVELESLGAEQFVQILTQPENALIKQYTALLATEGIRLNFAPKAIEAIAAIAHQLNQRLENIGARRLHSVMSTLLDEVLFETSSDGRGRLRITQDYVQDKLEDVLSDEDLHRYVL
jgi:ATP-dependent HslUV protease ATP-binding subunit HslU